ncbi:MAG: acyltransferase family protein [Promethearchaeota archaeon]
MDEEKKPQRIYFVDNLRILLTILVIMHHTMITYGALGGWYYIDPNIDESTSILLTVFAALNQGFFMGFFFLLSSYFTPGSYNRKGPRTFLKDRFIRLGIPILIYIAIVNPLMIYLLADMSESFFEFYFSYFRSWEGIENFINGSGPLWFTVTLLIFVLFYCLWRQMFKEKQNPEKEGMQTTPKNSQIILIIIIMNFLTFIVRLSYPLNGGDVILNIQVANIVQYSIMLILGTIAYKRDWFNTIPDSQGKLWLSIAALSVVYLITLGYVSGAFEGEYDNVLGGLTWESFVYTNWESIYCIAMSIGLIFLFRTKFNTQGKIIKTISGNTYTMYLIHAVVLVSVSVLFEGINVPPLLKFVIVLPIVILICFLISHFILRRIPGTKRILG